MDPDATLRLFWDAMDDGDFGAARDHADTILAWIARRGFAPLAFGSVERARFAEALETIDSAFDRCTD